MAHRLGPVSWLSAPAPEPLAQPRRPRDRPRHRCADRRLEADEHEALLRTRDRRVEQLAGEDAGLGGGEEDGRGPDLRALRLVDGHRIERLYSLQASRADHQHTAAALE